MLAFDAQIPLSITTPPTSIRRRWSRRPSSPGDVFRWIAVSAFRLTAPITRPSSRDPGLSDQVEAGLVAALAGDTVSLPQARRDVQGGADVYVQTVIREDLVRRVPSQRLQDILDYHSTVEQAAQTAERAGVRTLMLTHYVPPLFPGQEEEWRAFPGARALLRAKSSLATI